MRRDRHGRDRTRAGVRPDVGRFAGVIVAMLVAAAGSLWFSMPASASGMLGPGGSRCFTLNGTPGAFALVNLTPVLADRAGDGKLVAVDADRSVVASNVNYRPGTVDPNVAVAAIAGNRQVCFVNSPHANVHLVADHLGTIDANSYTAASTSGAPDRRLDTRGGSKIGRGARRCFTVAGQPGDVALVNLTPVLADGAGDGQLVSSDVTNPPIASNVNYRPGTVDPNVAAAPIGTNGKVCFVNANHTSIHLVADHLGTIDADAYTAATSSGGAPDRKLDTRNGFKIGPSGRRCFSVAGEPGDAALVNLTPVFASGNGDGQLVSSDVTDPPVASNVNYTAGSVNPNLAVAAIGADGKVCYQNSTHTSVHLVADHLGTIDASAYTPANTDGSPDRRVDTRTETGAGPTLLEQLTVANQNTSVTYDRGDWPHWIDADGDCQNTRAEVLIRDSTATVTFTVASNGCTVATGRWYDPWTDQTFTVASDVDIDHTVALANAHRSGGWAWDTDKKRAFANDLGNLEALRAMDDGTNSSKSDKGPEAWKPPAAASWCTYATDWATIKVRWDLTVTAAEHQALGTMIDRCEQPPQPPAPTTTTTAPPTTTTTTVPASNCDPSYPTVCIPPPPPDLNCGDIPYRNFVVLQPDPHRFDGNKDGIGCST